MNKIRLVNLLMNLFKIFESAVIFEDKLNSSSLWSVWDLLMDDETYKLWRIKKTILKMCRDRGYLVMEKELEQTLEDFKENVGDPPDRKNLLMVVNHEEDPADMLYVFFPDEDRVNMKTIRAYVDQMQTDQTYKAILVLREGGLTPAAKSVSFYDS